MSEVSVRGAAPQSYISYRIGGKEYPLKTNRQCKVCMSPHRFEVEQALVAGRTYGKIVESLPDDADLSNRNVKDHYLNQHMPLEQAAIREIVETRAQRVGKQIEEGVESLVDGITLLQTTVQKTFEAIADGTLQPVVADGVQAARILASLGEYDEGGGVDQQAIVDAFMVYHENAQAFMSPEQFQAFGESLERNPVLKALASRFDGDTVEGEVEESEQG